MKTPITTLLAFALPLLLGACSGTDAPPSPDASLADLGSPDAGLADSGLLDQGLADLGPVDQGSVDAGPSGYAYSAPPMDPVPPALASATWLRHWTEDIRPFWMQDAALGTPPGNYPTYRGREGAVQPPSERRPRMLARQVYAYSMGYLMTGEPALLERARLGVRWLLDHAVDPRGGCHERLDAQGQPLEGPKYAQDTAYCALGMAAYFFVTRDREVEAALLALRDLLFDPAVFWDAENGRIRDGRSPDLAAEVDQESDGGWELVAQLDAVNGFLLLSQPVLHDPARRDQLLGDLRTLSQSMIQHFWQDGIFWGVSTNKGRYGTRHVDYGHTLKAYWMILEVDKRLADHPFQLWLNEHLDAWITRAFDGRRWMKRPIDGTRSEPGSDWWIYAEADQIAATRNWARGTLTETLASTGASWVTDYVDDQWGGEVFSGIRPTGQPAYAGPPTDTFKCNLWKNGYHSTEHALVMYLHGRWLEGQPARLHFAVPEPEAASFPAPPYFFHGEEVGRTQGSTLAAGSATLRQVQVDIDRLW